MESDQDSEINSIINDDFIPKALKEDIIQYEAKISKFSCCHTS